MDFKMISARRILASRDDVRQSMTHVCSKHFCNPMSEADLIKQRKLEGPPIHNEVFVCKFRQIHECGQGVCTEGPKNGVCPKTGLYVGHPENGFLRNPTYTFRKATSGDKKRRDANYLKGLETKFVQTKRKAPGVFNFATALIGQDAMKRTKEENKAKEIDAVRLKEERMIEEEEKYRKRRRTIDEEIEDEEIEREMELYGDGLDDDDEEGIVWGKAFKEKKARRERISSSSSLTKADVLRPYTTKPTIPFKKKRKEDLGQLRRDAENLVITLFYSDTREKINEQKRCDAADRSKRKIRAYMQAKKAANKPWIVIEVLTIDANERIIEDHITTLDVDEDMISYFSSVIMRAWEIVNASPWGHNNQGRINFDQHCLGVLYHMRRGYQPDDVVYIPRHDYMRFLPHVNDLKEFGFEKKNVKSGMKAIQDAYRSAKEDMWPPSKLRIHNKDMSMTHGRFI